MGRAAPLKASILSCGLVLALIGALATDALSKKRSPSPFEPQLLRWQARADIGCRAERGRFNGRSYPYGYRLKAVNGASDRGRDIYLLCPDQKPSRLIYARYRPGQGVIDRATIKWQGLERAPGFTICCLTRDGIQSYSIAHRAGTSYVAFLAPEGKAKIAERRNGGGWRIRTLSPKPGHTIGTVRLASGRAGVYLAFKEAVCDERIVEDGVSAPDSCRTSEVRATRIDRKRLQPKTVHSPTEGISGDDIAVTSDGAYVALSEGCVEKRLGCVPHNSADEPHSSVFLYRVRGDRVVNATPSALLTPKILRSPRLAVTRRGLDLAYGRSKPQPGESPPSTTGRRWLLRLRNGKWGSPVRMRSVRSRRDVTLGRDLISRGGQLVTTDGERPKVQFYVGAGKWVSCRPPKAKSGETVAAAPRRIYVGSYPFLFPARLQQPSKKDLRKGAGWHTSRNQCLIKP